MVLIETPLRRRAGGGIIALLALLWLVGGAFAQAQPDPASDGAMTRPVFIELFTSQGCSSCPPADKLIAKLAKQPGVIALSLPVDLWDYVGWKDTLAAPYHSQRQRQYAKARGDNRVYTPQAIINGIAHVVGSDPAAIKTQAAMCYGRDGALSVAMRTEGSAGGLRVEVGAASENSPKLASLWLVQVASRREVQIKRGENAGQTFTYVNVARSFARIGEWTGAAMSFRVSPNQLTSAESDGWVLILQASENDRPGAVLAAVKSPGL